MLNGLHLKENQRGGKDNGICKATQSPEIIRKES